MTSPTSTLIPDLTHRAPGNRWVVALPDRLTAGWIDEQFDALLAHVEDAGDDPAAWADAVRWYNELLSHVATVFARISLAFRQASDDEAAAAENRRRNNELSPAWEQRDIQFSRALLDSACLDAVRAEFGDRFVQQHEVARITNDPVNVGLRSQLADVLMDYTSIYGKATMRWRGEELPFSYAGKAALDPDRDERHAAHRSVVEFVERAEPDLQRIYDEALQLRHQMAANLDLEGGYVELRYMEMGRDDWGPADAAKFRAAVEEHVVPLGRRIRAWQAAAQGVDLVHPADLEIWPEATPQLAVPLERQLEVAASVFQELGPEVGDPFAEMVRERLVDLPARPGKGTGAFCTGFADQRVPYIFCNSVGSPDDIRTLVHEYGHALQFWRSSGIELVALRHPTLEACEIHSMTLELLALPYMEQFFGDDAEVFRRGQLRGTALLMPYIACVDEFQHEIYGAGAEEAPDAAARNALWEQLTRRYRPGIDWDADPFWARARWLRQLHLFQYPFYYLDYALAQMVSWQLWLDSLEDRDRALATYLRLCELGGTMPFREMVHEAGMRDPFEPGVVAETVGRLEPHLGITG